MIDTHCHLNFDAFDADRDQVVSAARSAGVAQIVVPAVDLDSCEAVIHLAHHYDGVYAAVGIHPTSTADFDESMITMIAEQAQDNRVVAIGEIGLDYHWDTSPKATQHRAFRAQIDLAAQLEKPVIIHNREASDDLITILEEWVVNLPSSLRSRPGVLHSFSAPMEIAQRALALGFYLGFTGPITYKKADDLRQIAASVPLDRILVETDAPFLPPTPHRGKRNEPQFIPLMVERLAVLHRISVEAMAAQTTENAKRLFGLTA